MRKIKYYIEKNRILIILIVLLIVILFSVYCALNNKNHRTENEIQNIELNKKQERNKEIIKTIKVDIKGLVKSPGVYELKEGDRVIDLITAAGGLLDNSNTEYINLSKKLIDEMIIIIYSNDSVENYKKTDKDTLYIKYECECLDNINDACIDENSIVNTVMDEEEKEDVISINTGSLEDLMRLDGIGESKAKSIIDYREEIGGFKDLEDIKNVSGIGEAAYSKIKDHIKL